MIGRILTVAGREVRSYFDHATAYILLVIFLAVNFFFFFQEVFLIGEGSLRPMFGMLPWLLLFFVPAVTMRSLAEERRSGTLELVLAQPVTELEFLLGKFLGVMAFLAVALAGTLGAPIGLSLGADLQWGVIVAQYVGSLLLLAGLVAVGLWASSMTRNQVTAFILGVTTIFFFYLLGLQVVTLSLPGALGRAVERLGILGHFENIARGVIDLRDVLYFVALTAAFLSLSYFSLLRRRLSREREGYRRLVWGTAGLVGVSLMIGLLGSEIRGRLDLTPGNVYTLSDATQGMLQDLDDLVTIQFFTSKGLPPEFSSVQRDVEDLLADYDAAGDDRLRIVRQEPEGQNDARQLAERLGIPPIEFNVVGEEEFQVQRGYLGLAIQYAGESETIPVIRRTADLEYRLTAAIRNLTTERLPHVAFLQGHGEKSLFTDMTTVADQLRDGYTVGSLTLDSATTQVPDSVDVLVVAGSQRPLPDRDAAALRTYLEGGGSAFLMVPGTRIDQRTRFATPLPHPRLDSLLARYGVEVVGGLAYDLRLNSRVQLRGEGGFGYLLPYPLWLQSQPASPHITVEELGTVSLPWTSPLRVGEEAQADSGAVIPLLATSQFAGVIEGPTSVDATRDWSGLATDSLAPRILGLALAPGRGAAGEETGSATSGAAAGRYAAGPARGARESGETQEAGEAQEADQAQAGAAAQDTGEPATEAPPGDTLPRDTLPGGGLVGDTPPADTAGAPSPMEATGGTAELPVPYDPPRGRIILVGSADFATDDFLRGSPNNLRFVLNAVDWLAQDEALIAIRSKDRTAPRLLFSSGVVRDAVKYGNLIGVPLLFVLFGILRLARRRRLQSRRYGEVGAEGPKPR